MLSKARRRGFTLVELLVVIAIIAILASLVAVALPRALERAKIARMTGAMNQIRTSLTQYYTQNNSYPPAYGYRNFGTREIEPFSTNAWQTFWVSSFMGALQLYSAIELYDEFSESYSTEQPPTNNLKLLEFSPIARTEGGRALDMAPVQDVLYDGGNLSEQVQGQLEQTARPFIYVPVNLAQFNRAKRYWQENGDWLATRWDYGDSNGQLIQAISFPPPNYDAYVLISVGPGGGTFGLLDDPPFIGSIMPEDRYHLIGLRAYFLATRDMNGNGVRDFHYEDRARGEEADAEAQDHPVTPLMQQFFQNTLQIGGDQLAQVRPNSLPSRERFNGYGPWIYVPD